MSKIKLKGYFILDIQNSYFLISKIFCDIQKKNDYFGYKEKIQISEIVISDISECLFGYLEKRKHYYG